MKWSSGILQGLFGGSGAAPSYPIVRRRRARNERWTHGRHGFFPSLDEAHEALPAVVRLSPATSWVCQFQKIDHRAICECPADVVVIDTAPDGNPRDAFSPAQVEAMRVGTGGRRKAVIAYMSIGEAEQYRFYWDPRWTKRGKTTRAAPRWLNELNGDGWEGNWSVRFWESGWQDLIVGKPNSFLDRIIDAGFDGVFLDLIDAYSYWADEDRGLGRRPTAGRDMIAFVKRIARHARQTRGKPGFIVMPLNGEQLLQDDSYRATVSVLAKEDVLFKMVGEASESHIEERPKAGDDGLDDIMQYLRIAIADGIPVLDLEYVHDSPSSPQHVAQVIERLRTLGLVPHLCTRNLDVLSPVILPEAGV